MRNAQDFTDQFLKNLFIALLIDLKQTGNHQKRHDQTAGDQKPACTENRLFLREIRFVFHGSSPVF